MEKFKEMWCNKKKSLGGSKKEKSQIYGNEKEGVDTKRGRQLEKVNFVYSLLLYT